MPLIHSLPKIDQYENMFDILSNILMSAIIGLPGGLLDSTCLTTDIIASKVFGCTPHKRLNSDGFRCLTAS